MLGQCLVPWRVSQGCLGSRSGHQLNSILLVSNNQGSVYKKCAVYKYTIKVGARFVFLSSMGPSCQWQHNWSCPCFSQRTRNEVEGPWGAPCQLKKPFKGPESTWRSWKKERKRAINPLWPVVTDLPSRQIWWFFTKSKAKKNEFVFKPVDEGSLIVPELECCPITFWLAEDWSARAGRGVLQIPTGTAKFRPNFSIWCLFGFNSSSPVLYVKLCCNYFILFFPSVLKFWCSKYFIASLTWSCSHWYMGRENRIGIETQKRLLSSYAIWLNKNFQVNTFTGFFGQNKTQVPKNSKLKQDTEKNSRKIPKTQITATPVFSKLSNTFSNFWKYFKNSWKDLKT